MPLPLVWALICHKTIVGGIAMAPRTMKNTALAAALATGLAGAAPSKPAEAYGMGAMVAPMIINLAAKAIFSSAFRGRGHQYHEPFDINPLFGPAEFSGQRNVIGYDVRSRSSPHNAYIRDCRDGTLAAKFQGQNYHLTPNPGLEGTLILTPVEGNPCAYGAERGRNAPAFNRYGGRVNGGFQSMRVPVTENVIGDNSKVEIYLGIAHKDGRKRSEYGVGSSDIRITDQKDTTGAVAQSAYDLVKATLPPEVFEQALRNAVPQRTKTHKRDWQTVWNVWTEINGDTFNNLCGYGTLKMDKEREPRYGADVCGRGKPTPNGKVLYGLQIVVPQDAMKEPFRAYVPGPGKK